MKPIIGLLTLAGLLTLTTDAEACRRCGLFGNRCKFVQRIEVQKVQKVYAAPVQAYQQPTQTIVIQNNVSGQALTSPLALQGSTLYAQAQAPYGYQTAAAAYSVNPEAILNQAARLTENAQNLAERGFEQYTTAATLQLSGQAEVAKIVAATQHLKAATAVSSTQSITVTQQGNKKTVTTQPPLEPQPSEPPPEPLPPLPSNAPAAFVSCVRCHSGPTPKGRLSLDLELFDPAVITKSLRMIRDEKMPPADSGIVLSQQEKGEIMQFLLDRDSSAQPEPNP